VMHEVRGMSGLREPLMMKTPFRWLMDPEWLGMS
jgi:hypothetical protein